MKTFVLSFTAAFGFLTRLAPPRIYDDKVFAATIGWFPLVGFVLGTLLTAPFALGVLRGQPWIQAWLLLGGSLALTRGLHWDGWADLFDGWGSNAQGQRFWDIVKDSRTGAFGVIALVMGLSGQLLLLHQALAAEAYTAVAFAFILGRSLAACTAFCGRSLVRAGNGKLFLAGATVPVILLVIAQTLFAALFVIPPITIIPTLCLCLLGLVELVTLARRNEGMNGDFLGAAVIWGEISALLGWCIAANMNLPLLP
ncbi:adenosylcobinamide-GDP ribazoletransferase [Desulfobaculum xiamenense]|uniref:Adenosylcobinamide-GDP ribazoletransferase n=1 Tax=Desulfobaculum xiamenense TaxID=995050 RepID=A0A846QIS2_9BACT|nr:adenosylcobinamide-GDP ribazoletransferase [Desulfobaculum xiamenense]NJB68138.1 adenosylcobinamide-GDP ribazoletransferase [Desulfobaculum xiamenense]